MNQARSLVNVYTDGSVNISTAAVEMGQGVNTKMLQVAAKIFSISPESIKVNSTNTYRIANTSPTAASAAADLNGKATALACEAILQRMKQVAAAELKASVDDIKIKDGFVYANGSKTEMSWEKLAMLTHVNKISLSELAHYTPPGIYFDATIERVIHFLIMYMALLLSPLRLIVFAALMK
jgi:xanthine dehydrogenase large subunit